MPSTSEGPSPWQGDQFLEEDSEASFLRTVQALLHNRASPMFQLTHVADLRLDGFKDILSMLVRKVSTLERVFEESTRRQEEVTTLLASLIDRQKEHLEKMYEKFERIEQRLDEKDQVVRNLQETVEHVSEALKSIKSHNRPVISSGDLRNGQALRKSFKQPVGEDVQESEDARLVPDHRKSFSRIDRPSRSSSSSPYKATFGCYTSEGSGEGLLVTETAPGGAAALANILPGDLIVSFNHARVLKTADLVAELRKCQGGETILVTILRTKKRTPDGSITSKEELVLPVTLGARERRRSSVSGTATFTTRETMK